MPLSSVSMRSGDVRIAGDGGRESELRPAVDRELGVGLTVTPVRDLKSNNYAGGLLFSSERRGGDGTLSWLWLVSC